MNFQNRPKLFGLLQQTLILYLRNINTIIESHVHKHSPPPERNFNGGRVRKPLWLEHTGEYDGVGRKGRNRVDGAGPLKETSARSSVDGPHH